MWKFAQFVCFILVLEIANTCGTNTHTSRVAIPDNHYDYDDNFKD